ncbi:MAG: hypothetical protein HY094_01645 [Candidatus Melainabacteria bacterium]|nr:hypothetical protein [Candidatus Melainabacteria bacterium]
MNIWVDIDELKFLPLLEALLEELQSRNHYVVITTENKKEIKDVLLQHNINVKCIGKIFSFYGLFINQSRIIRSFQLYEYVKYKNINVALSFGSFPLFYTCMYNNITTILFTDEYMAKICDLHYTYEHNYFIFPDFIPNETLISVGYDLSKVAKIKCLSPKEYIKKEAIKEFADTIENLNQHKFLLA